MLEHYLAAASDGNGGIELVRMAGERVQLLRGLGPGQRLVEKAVPKRRANATSSATACLSIYSSLPEAAPILSSRFWRTWISRSGVACRLTTSGFVTLSS